MKIEDQVCSLEQAKKLNELGVDQNSLNWWKCNDEQIVVVCGCTKRMNERYFHFNTWHSAFTVAELGLMLPNGYDTIRLTDNNGKDGWKPYDINDDLPFGYDKYFQTEAEARAAMLIYLLERKPAIKSKQINQKIK